jgi:hypothetical protein
MKILLILLLTFNCFAQQMVKLDEGQKAPFAGILSDSEQMKTFRKTNEELKLTKKQNITLKELAVVQERQAKLYKEESDAYRTQLRREQVKSFWAKVGYFALGVLVTGLAAKTAIEASR